MRNNNQRGIVIGPILAVVALLAVLASAIAAGSGSFNGDTSAVKAKAQASAILGYVNEVQIGVDRVLSRCPDTQISLANSVDSGYAENPLAPADKSCHVFDVNGGGVLIKEPPQDVDLTGVPPEIRYYFIHGNYRVMGFGNMPSDVGGNSGRELIIMLPGLRRELCLKINDMADVTMESGDIPIGGGFQAVKESQYWADASSGWTVVCGTGGQNWGKSNCCTKTTGNISDARIPIGSYVFFHVLHTR